MQSQGSTSEPELCGSNITLDSVTSITDVFKHKTKIICTLGPACWEVSQLETLIDAGMGVAQFNCSQVGACICSKVSWVTMFRCMSLTALICLILSINSNSAFIKVLSKEL